MSTDLIKIPITPWMDIEPFLENQKLKSINIDPAGSVFLMTCDPLPPHSKYQNSTTQGFTQHRIPTAYQIYDLTYGITYAIPPQLHNFNNFQTLPDGKLLLVCSRQHDEPNAQVYDHDGNVVKDMILGDGIEDVQTTLDGSIWVSYFDEGALGWAQTCLIRYDPEGNIPHRFLSPLGETAMADCYALNVVSENVVWCCTFTEFPLVNVLTREFWRSPIYYAHAFAVNHDLVLFPDGSDETGYLHLFEFGAKNQLIQLSQVQLISTDGDKINPYKKLIVARGDVMLILDGTKLYRFSIDDLIQGI
ncbi:MAG: hypothetical protein L0154_25820 [Chloroflexi bacterium]|nr:hypothetical protein [Chloroflexota bacterium]